MFRKRVRSKSRDKRIFSKTARRVHDKNLMSGPMRGGYRI